MRRVCAGYAPGMRRVCAGCPGMRVCAGCPGMRRYARVCAGYAPGARVCAGATGMRRVCAGCPGMRRVPGYAPSMRWVPPPPVFILTPCKGLPRQCLSLLRIKGGKPVCFKLGFFQKPLEANKGKTCVLQTWVPHKKLWPSFSWQRSLGVCRWSKLVRESIQGSC